MNKKLFLLIATIVFTAQSASAATITGTIIYKGEQPKLKEIKMDADPICVTHHNEPVQPKSIVLGENNEMDNVFVYLSDGVQKKQYPIPSEPVVLDQRGCMYEPPVFGVLVGQDLKILNPDGTLHNVHALSKVNPEFNLAMPKFRTEVTKVFNKPEMQIQIKCDVHPWMITYGNVMEHPYFDVTEKDGTYTIENVPAGEYVVEAWQQRLEPQRITVTVAEGETKTVDFTFSRPDGK